MKKVVIGLVVVILSIALLVTLPFMFKSNQEDYIDFSKVSENVDDNGKDDDTLRIGLISVAGDNKSYILEKELANYIGEKLNKKVKLIQKKSYSDINLLLKNNQIDVAFLSTGAYSLYEDKESLELLARPNRGKAYYHPIIITKNDSNINTIEELKNNSFAFVDTYSYSGYLVFNDYLKKNGTTANKFFSNSYFTHSHEESINQVINGRVSAAIVDDWALQYMSSNFSGIENNIKIIKTFPEVATGPVVTHKNYEDKEKIKQILLSIDKDNYSQDFHVLVSSINEMVDSNKKNKKLNNYLLNKVFRIQEEERKMLSRELHDEVSQSLASLLFLLSNLVEKETDKVKKDRLLLIQSEIENSLTNIRNIAVNLRPPSAELSLEEVISKYIEDYKNLYGISVDFYSNYEGGKNDNFDITLYRIIQESLSNIKRHSKATEVIVKLYSNSDYIILSIADNGIGLTKERVESAKKEGRLGIFGIQERILDFSGEFKVLNNKKYSTIIMCKFKTETIEEKSNENTID